MAPLNTPTHKQKIHSAERPLARMASLPWLSIATILMSLVMIGYVALLMM
jgi:hypothetical protein